jgi:hypothetical protein
MVRGAAVATYHDVSMLLLRDVACSAQDQGDDDFFIRVVIENKKSVEV